jgi:hypothetical protein
LERPFKQMRAKNHWKPWTRTEERRLVQLAERSVPVHAIAVELDRSVEAVRNKAKGLGVRLPLYNQRRRPEVTTPAGDRTRTTSSPSRNNGSRADASNYSYR